MLTNLWIVTITRRFTITSCRDTGAVRITNNKSGTRLNLITEEDINIFWAEYDACGEKSPTESSRIARIDALCADYHNGSLEKTSIY